MKRLKSNKGITLVALIITIIVLLILAVVAIRAVQGDGIIKHAQNAKEEYSKAQAEEAVKLALNEWKIVGNVTPSAVLGDFLKEKFGEDKVKDNGDETYTVTVNGYDVTVDKDGNITSTTGNENPKDDETTETGGLTIYIAGIDTEKSESVADGDFITHYDRWNTMIDFTKEEYEQALQAMGKGTGESLYWSDAITGQPENSLSSKVEWTSGCFASLNSGLASGETIKSTLGDQTPEDVNGVQIEDNLMYIFLFESCSCVHPSSDASDGGAGVYHDVILLGLVPIYKVQTNFIGTTVTPENYEQVFANAERVKAIDTLASGYYCIDFSSKSWRDLTAAMTLQISEIEATHSELGLNIDRK